MRFEEVWILVSKWKLLAGGYGGKGDDAGGGGRNQARIDEKSSYSRKKDQYSLSLVAILYDGYTARSLVRTSDLARLGQPSGLQHGQYDHRETDILPKLPK